MRKVLLALSAAILAAFGMANSAKALLPAGANAGTVTVNPNGSITVVGPSGTYDGVEDVAYDVINNSTGTLFALNLSGAGIFGLDGDGIGNYIDSAGNPIAGHGFGVVRSDIDPSNNGYAGYTNGSQNSFTIIDINTGIIHFDTSGGLPGGSSSWFSLEAPAGANGQVIITPVPLPAAAWMGMITLGGMALLRKRKTA